MKWISLFILVALFAIESAHAGNQRNSYDFSVGAGISYDSDAGIPEIDSSSGTADTITNLNIGLDAKFRWSPKITSLLSYDYSDSSYQRFAEFDLGLHHARAGLAINTSFAGFGIAVDRYDGVLAGNHYLALTHVSPSVSRLFGTRLFLRIAYQNAHKRYDELNDRNATSSAMRFDSYFLLDGMRRFIAISSTNGEENATSFELDHKLLRVALTYAHQIDLPRMQLNLKARFQHEKRDYSSITLKIGERRHDMRNSVGVITSVPFSDRFEMEARLTRTFNRSNLPTAELDKLVAELGFLVSF